MSDKGAWATNIIVRRAFRNSAIAAVRSLLAGGYLAGHYAVFREYRGVGFLRIVVPIEDRKTENPKAGALIVGGRQIVDSDVENAEPVLSGAILLE